MNTLKGMKVWDMFGDVSFWAEVKPHVYISETNGDELVKQPTGNCQKTLKVSRELPFW